MPCKQPVKIGQRIICVRMEDDPDPVKPGTMGTVQRVWQLDAEWVISTTWDDGRIAALVYPGDRFLIEDDSMLDNHPEIVESYLESAVVLSLCDARKQRKLDTAPMQKWLFDDVDTDCVKVG